MKFAIFFFLYHHFKYYFRNDLEWIDTMGKKFVPSFLRGREIGRIGETKI